MSDHPGIPPHPKPPPQPYPEQMLALRTRFDHTLQQPSAGTLAVAARSAAVDRLVRDLWAATLEHDPTLRSGVALLAVGGFGRGELFPASDVDLLFLLDTRVSEAAVKQSLRQLNQRLWDEGLRVSPLTRTLAECGRFQPENVEFTLSLFESRPLAGDAAVSAQLLEKTLPKLIDRDRKRIQGRLLEVIRTRHARFGDTLFHLEPNVKECPGGLRDAQCCAWLARLAEAPARLAEAPSMLEPQTSEFQQGREFLLLVRAFLHLRHGRDDNTLDWHTQDEAAAVSLGLSRPEPPSPRPDASYWMRSYFRHARAIERHTAQAVDAASGSPGTLARLQALSPLRRALPTPAQSGFELRNGRLELTSSTAGEHAPEDEPQVALTLFAAVARTGARLGRETERRLEDALPLLSAHLEDGPILWQHLRAILTGPFAGQALRSMHTLGILELVLPEFHGIDALVIRDAYHRYTVDEHTFVLIDTLHDLKRTKPAPALEPWAARFTPILHELRHPDLLFLAALLHDTGKGHSTLAHTVESTRLARSVLDRLELDPYEAGLVLDLIANHLEMSAALRRDIFDAETIRGFAARTATPEALRMLTLFTYADITAVHPDALTPWKAENLWRLFIAASNFLDRSVDDERIASAAKSELGEMLYRVQALVPERVPALTNFLQGFPRRYLQTRTPDSIRAHFEMALALPEPSPGPPSLESNQLDFRFAPALSELTLVTRDRPKLFASMTGVLAAWGMNIVTADAFSNAHGLVVDSFRFTDTFRTLELNQVERIRFVESVRSVMAGETSLELLLAGRQRTRRIAPKVVVQARIDFDDQASAHSTLMQIVAQDTPGLLRALSSTLAEYGCNIEVALIDTEGEMAIDVFYLTCAGLKLDPALQSALRQTSLEAIAAHAR